MCPIKCSEQEKVNECVLGIYSFPAVPASTFYLLYFGNETMVFLREDLPEFVIGNHSQGSYEV